jgi:hypothetical protein
LQLTASQFLLASIPSGTRDQILAVVKTIAVLFVVGRSPSREEGSVFFNRSQSLSVLAVYTYVHFISSLCVLSFL